MQKEEGLKKYAVRQFILIFRMVEKSTKHSLSVILLIIVQYVNVIYDMPWIALIIFFVINIKLKYFCFAYYLPEIVDKCIHWKFKQLSVGLSKIQAGGDSLYLNDNQWNYSNTSMISVKKISSCVYLPRFALYREILFDWL